MAAALLVGVAITTVVNTRIQLPLDPGVSVASANVVYLETLRSSGAADLPTVETGNVGQWISLIAYPEFGEATRLRIALERAPGSGTGDWQPILERVTGVGTQSSVVVNVKSGQLQPGEHRLCIEPEASAVPVDPTVLRFQVAN